MTSGGRAAGLDSPVGDREGSPDDSILGRVMIAFEGERLPDWVASRLRAAPVAGMTVFRHHNVRSPGQVRELIEAFQRAAAASARGGAGGAGTAPHLVAADQEGGQFQALGDDATLFAGNMALGAVGDDDLARRVGEAIGREARAMGINVVYAPSLDLALEPANAALGIRSFGDDPDAVARLGSAFIAGLQATGVAATIKHFPGSGSVREDSHYELGVIDGDRALLEATALRPFRAAIVAGARVAMSAHVAAPALTGGTTVPATLSSEVMRGVLRGDLGFDGVTISDALDMRALAQGAEQAAQIEAAVQAGVDLLLCSADREALGRIEAGLLDAVARGVFDPAELAASSRRIAGLRAWLGSMGAGAGSSADLSVVGCAVHRALSRELAERSITLVRGWDGGTPPRLPSSARILAIMPQPTDLTPADTSSTVRPDLARALRTRFAAVEEVVVGIAPSSGEIAALRERSMGFDGVVVGTIDAIRQPSQFELVRAVAAGLRPTVAVALRTPWDVAGYPGVAAAICTYSILPDPLEALAAALAGEIGFAGRLPVAVPGLAAGASSSGSSGSPDVPGGPA